MASICNRFISRSSPFIKSAVSIGAGICAVTVAATQRSGSGEDDFMPEHNIEELPGSFSGLYLGCYLDIISQMLSISDPYSSWLRLKVAVPIVDNIAN
ncbi:hypothetical protein Goshw_004422 [Gossypium schwendimanii]|uniref:Uncharacterized protein n=1 Tax=Gossypium schwendimanii TaxID=34291 RepID=A0A7J9L1B5_GOSSC|nr:hypothetical protein [Gossypium schwendimanii]